MQDFWLSKKAAKFIQSLADKKDMKKFNDALKTVYGPKSSKATHYLLQMEAQFSLIKMQSWKGGQKKVIEKQ